MAALRRILVANRGEIAVRVIRACRDLGLESVAVYSDADRDALHVRYADLAYHLGPAPASESYLDIERILEVAARCRADAIHPGYGFLAENAEFARRCAEAGLVFIGPSAECLALVGDKAAARRAAEAAGVPVVPGSPHPVADPGEAREWGRKLGFPIMLKAAAGGGGKGMRRVEAEGEVAAAFRIAGSEAASAFGDERLYVERALERPRHVEIQILADLRGNRVHLGERECTLQRRHQKVLEEAPSPIVDEALRAEMGEAALAVAAASGYTNAGTVEFLVDADRNFYFIEVNARLQVEHPVTEMLTGLDLVVEQIAAAEGRSLRLRQRDVVLRGHAIECRIYAEDPEQGFAPSPGVVEHLRTPGGPGIRNDTCLYEGCRVPVEYDPIVAKLVAWGPDREAAIRRLHRALEEYRIRGIATTIPLFLRVLEDRDFRAGRFDTGYLDRLLGAGAVAPGPAEEAQVARLTAALHVYLKEGARALRPPPPPAGWKLAGRLAALEDRWP